MAWTPKATHDWVPRVKIFAGKAAAGYHQAKLVIKQFPIAMGVKKGEPALLAKLNEWIAVNAKSGKLNALYRKHHGVDVPAELLQP